MNIHEEWILRDVEKGRQFPGATVCMDDGAYQTQSANRARRMVALWNAFLGVPLREIQKLAKRRKLELDRARDQKAVRRPRRAA